MRRRVSIAFLALAAPFVAPAAAVEIPGWATVEFHGRVETVVEMEEASTPFSNNHASRSPFARSRAMASGLVGDNRVGRLYLEGAARWSEFDAGDGAVRFEFEQGDYLWDRAVSVRLFANERRYFTSSFGPALIEDDRLERFHDHGGVRADGDVEDFSWTALGSVLDDDTDDMRRLGFASARWNGARVQAAVEYLSDRRDADTLAYHNAARVELAGFYRKATAVASYAHSGFGDDAASLAEGGFDWDGYVGGNFSSSLPDAGEAFGELRVGDLPFRDWGRVDIFHRYRATGSEFVADLAGARAPSEVSNTTCVFVRHRTLAVDGRVVHRKRVRSRFTNVEDEHVEAHASAMLNNGAEVFLRGAVGHRDESPARRVRDNFVHAALRRSMQRVYAGVHVMVKDIDDGDFDRRFAMETRVNWTANLSVYGRFVSREETAGNDALFWRVEFRPTDQVLATFEYGRRTIGDGPYLLEDEGIAPLGKIEPIYAITVRGDF